MFYNLEGNYLSSFPYFINEKKKFFADCKTKEWGNIINETKINNLFFNNEEQKLNV